MLSKPFSKKNIIDIKYEFDSEVNIKTEQYVYMVVEDENWNEVINSLKNARKQKLCLEILNNTANAV